MRPTLLRLVLRYGFQAGLVLAPLVTMEWSLLNVFGHSGAAPADTVRVLVFKGPKREVELTLRILITATALVGSLIFEAVDLYWPSRSLLRFRMHYLEEKRKEWRDKLSPAVRINIMYARRRWYFLWLVRTFEWTWNDGFDPPVGHVDANMWICEFQGVCGKAFRTMKPQSVYFDANTPEAGGFREKWFFDNKFHLSHRQLRRTRHLRAVLSIPILEQSDGMSPDYRSVGVINLDASSDAGMNELHKNERELAEYFTRLGKILAALRL